MSGTHHQERPASMTYAFTPVPQAALPIKGSGDLFPIHRIYCVGRNYAEHTKEMGGDTKDPPFFFQKNPDNVIADGTFPYPPQTQNVHHELELVVALKSGGVNIKAADAMSHVFGYAVGIDMTRRDLQDVAKKLARPWEVAKAFEASAPITAIVPAAQVETIASGAVWLDINGVRKQTGDLSQMIWDVPHQIEFLSTLFELKPGDLIFTGTPSGVGPVKKGDKLRGHVDGVGDLEVTVV
jgi:fumarylpyruvate hydrolase